MLSGTELLKTFLALPVILEILLREQENYVSLHRPALGTSSSNSKTGSGRLVWHVDKLTADTHVP